MKLTNVFITTAIIVILAVLIFGIPSDGESGMKNDAKVIKKTEQIGPVAPIENDDVTHIKIKSKVVKPKKKGNRPSYCSVRGYEILELSNGKFKIRYAGGTTAVDEEMHSTVEEAQQSINKYAAKSNQLWIDSDGTDW